MNQGEGELAGGVRLLAATNEGTAGDVREGKKEERGVVVAKEGGGRVIGGRGGVRRWCMKRARSPRRKVQKGGVARVGHGQ